MAAPVVTWKTEVVYTTSSSPTALISAQTFTDVSAYVREDMGCEIRRGRDDEQSEIAASTMSIHFDNNDGRFSPGSATWVNLDLGCVIRRTAIVDSVTHVRFIGYVDSIEMPDWVNAPFEKTVTITASDRLARIGAERAGTMLSPLEYENLELAPVLFYPMTEADGAQQITSTGSNPQPLLVLPNGGTLTFSGAPGVTSDSRNVPKFESLFDDTGQLTAGSNYLFNGAFRDPVTYDATHPVSISAWFRTDQKWPNAAPLATVFQLTDAATPFRVQINASGTLEGVIGAVTVTGPGIADQSDALYHVVLVAQQGVSAKMYVNDVLYTGANCTSSNIDHIFMNIGGPWHGSISMVGVFRAALTQANVDAIYAAGITGFNGMLSDAAMTAVAGYAGVPAAEVVASPPAQTRVGDLQTAGKSAAEVMRQVAGAEGGIVFVDATGIVRFHTRPKRWNVGSVQYSIPNGDVVDAMGLSYNDKFICNEAKVSRTNGTMSRYVDATSQTKRGIYAQDLEFIFYTDAETVSRARQLVIDHKDPTTRTSGIPVRIYTSLDAEDLMNLDIGSLVTVAGLSSDAPSSLSKQWIEGVTESQSIHDYTITFSTSPVLPTEIASAGFFRVGSGATSQIGSSAMIAP